MHSSGAKVLSLMPRRFLPQDREIIVHCISRVVDRNFIFGEVEKRHFCKWMRKLEQFCGVQVVTYCLMSNHFHLLVKVPDRELVPDLTPGKLRELLPLIYRQRALRDAIDELERAEAAAQSGSSAWLIALLRRYQNRRHSISHFLKDLKQRFTRWYNRQSDRSGTLWEDRFRSVLVENGEQALLTMAAYIDLNPVRAGLVADPKDYIWCGYAAAVAGNQAARKGLCEILEHTRYGTNRKITWSLVAAKYRRLLYDHGEQRSADPTSGSNGRLGLTRSQIEAEIDRGGQPSIAQVLRCKLRPLTEGLVFGSVAYVEEFFETHRDHFGPRRKTGARKLPAANWGELRVIRNLQKNRIGR